MNKAIGIDIGGSRVKGVAIDAEGNVLCRFYADIDHNDGVTWKLTLQFDLRSCS